MNDELMQEFQQIDTTAKRTPHGLWFRVAIWSNDGVLVADCSGYSMSAESLLEFSIKAARDKIATLAAAD